MGTKYEAIAPLFESKNCIIFSQDLKIPQLLKISKKSPQMTLLAGIAENRLLSRNEMVNLATLPDITTARAQFVSVLNSIGGGVVQHLQAHQTNLAGLLDSHAKQLADVQGKVVESDDTKTESA